MPSSGNKFDIFVQDLAQKQHNLAGDALKVMLSDVAPAASNTIKTNITEITAANGYTAGGNAPTLTSCVQTSGLLKLILQDTTFTATANSIGPFRYVVFYNSTNSKLIGWWDDGSERTLNITEQYVIDFDQSNGVLAIQ